jgi:hypothetical protein
MTVDVEGDVDEPVIDTWHVWVGCWCATWPSHGLPRGTLWLVVRFICKILWCARESNPRPPIAQRTGRAGITTRPSHGSCYVNDQKYI